MEKAISTALFVIASVAAAIALINAVVPAMGRSSSALLNSNADATQRIQTDHDIVFVVGDRSANEITLWAKNVGSEVIDRIDEADLFLKTPSTAKRVQWASTGDCPNLISGGTECWEYVLEDGASSWSTAGTIKITVRLNALELGVHEIKLTLRNGVSDEAQFSA